MIATVTSIAFDIVIGFIAISLLGSAVFVWLCVLCAEYKHRKEEEDE